MNIRLTAQEGARERHIFRLRADEIIIGRRKGASVRIPSSEVSRRHCRLFVQNGELWVEDLNSSNGTRLNNESVSAPLRVLPGDQLEVGPVVFIVEHHPEGSYADTQLDLDADAIADILHEPVPEAPPGCSPGNEDQAPLEQPETFSPSPSVVVPLSSGPSPSRRGPAKLVACALLLSALPTVLLWTSSSHPTVTVSGEVIGLNETTENLQPVMSGQIRFYQDGKFYSARIAEGNFILENIPTGMVKIIIESPPVESTEGSEAPPWFPVSDKYARVETTPLQVELPEEATHLRISLVSNEITPGPPARPEE